MIFSLFITSVISGVLLLHSGLLTGEFNYQEFLMKIPIVAPFIWIAWSNSQRNNHLIRIQEDYAFKYASAMTFEGYRKQVQEIDADLEIRLLSLAVENMGVSPVRLFGKSIKCSPAHDAFNGVAKATKFMADSVTPKSGKEK